MATLKIRVENPKIIEDAPRGSSESTEQEPCLADPQAEMTAEDLTTLQAALNAGWRSMEARRYQLAGEVLAEVLSKRSRRIP